MIIVTGASGQLGAQVVEHLLDRVPADDIGVSVRDPERAAPLAARGVRVRAGDFGDPSTLTHAFDGASQVLVVSVDTLGEQGTAQNAAAIDAAYRAGAERVLYTSHQAANPDSAFPPARDHAAVEAYLERLGRPFTSLRNGFYASSLRYRVGDAPQTGRLVAPADGPVSWTAPADLAEAAAEILTRAEPFEGPTPPLTANAAIDLGGVAAVLSQMVGREVHRVVIDDEEWVAHSVEHGIPEAMARLFLGTFEAARRGEFAVTDPTLQILLGREPRPVGAGVPRDRAHPAAEGY